MTEAKILIIDDNQGVLSAGKLLLKRHFAVVETSPRPDDLPELLGQTAFDLVLLDMNFYRSKNTGQEGLFWLGEILKIRPATAVVLITAFGDVDLAVRAIKAGATDFVLKPWDNERLLATLLAALDLKKMTQADQNFSVKNEAEKGPSESKKGPRLISKSAAFERILETVEKVAPTDANILITGENGTGKDLVAELIHSKSMRYEKKFVRTDLGSLAETLLESELFGHVRGAFTDARDDRAGRFEEAEGGTVFLDEIGNLSAASQAKMLTVLQNREVTRLGSNRSKKVDVRIVAATNEDLEKAVRERRFRQDLLYRLNTIELRIPPLRERIEDIEPLAEHFLAVFSKKYDRKIDSIMASTMRELKRYAWPGNVRELQHAVERAVIMSSSAALRPEDFFFKNSEPTAHPNTMNLEETERILIQKALEKHHGNITEAARELGLTRASLYRRLEKHQS